MRKLQRLAIFISVIVQPGLAFALELRKPRDNEITVRRANEHGTTVFYVNNETNRLSCVWAAVKYKIVGYGIPRLNNDSPILLLPYERQKRVASFDVIYQTGKPAPSEASDIRLAISSVPGTSERPSMKVVESWNWEDRRDLKNKCAKEPLIVGSRQGGKMTLQPKRWDSTDYDFERLEKWMWDE
jgi:hypothetical protein